MNLDNETWLITLICILSVLRWHWILPLHGGPSFCLSYRKPQHGSCDHGLTFLIVCKIHDYDFSYYPNLLSLESHTFQVYVVLFNAKKLQHVWFSQFVCENLFLVYCLHRIQVRKCVLDISNLEVCFPPYSNSGVSYSENSKPLKDHVQYCLLIWLKCHQLFCSLKAILYMVGQLSV